MARNRRASFLPSQLLSTTTTVGASAPVGAPALSLSLADHLRERKFRLGKVQGAPKPRSPDVTPESRFFGVRNPVFGANGCVEQRRGKSATQQPAARTIGFTPAREPFPVPCSILFFRGTNAGVDNSQILSIFLRGALGSRGRKRARRAASFLTGKRGFLTASTLLGAAGVAWGVYDSLTSGATGAPGATGAVPIPGATGATGAVLPPPIPGAASQQVIETAPVSAEDRGLPLEVLRVVRLAVSAARADGALLPAERALILSHAREAGVESTVEGELAVSRPLAEIVGGITDGQKKQDLYVLAYAIVRADESVTGAERIYLAQLAHQLGLDAATTTRLEQDTASKINAEPETTP